MDELEHSVEALLYNNRPFLNLNQLKKFCKNANKEDLEYYLELCKQQEEPTFIDYIEKKLNE
jgi:hypothetical protein